MKKIILLATSLLLILTFVAGCGKNERSLYNVDLKEYIEIGKYKGVEVDTKSDKYKEYYNAEIENDITANDLYKELSEGVVQEGDIANIDYIGTKDGVQFEGGTATQYELEIGSGTFIEGFEEGLIGMEIGSMKDLNLTFPENYGKEELNGADVVFSVNVNSVKRAMEPKEAYKKLGFKTLKAYELDLKERACVSCIIDKLAKDAKVKKYSDKDLELLYKAEKKQMESYYSTYYGMDFASVLSNYGMTEETYKESALENSIKPQSKVQMVIYYIFDEEGMEFTSDEVNAKINEIVEANEGATIEKVKDVYGEHYFEYEVVREKVSELLYKKAKIK